MDINPLKRRGNMKRCKVMEIIKNMLLAVLLLATGVLMFVLQSSIFDVLQISSYVALGVGVYLLVHYFVNAKQLPNAKSLFLAFVFLGAGLSMVLVPELIIYFMGVAFAAVGGYLLASALEAKKAGKQLVKDLVSGILHVVLGLPYVFLIWYVADSFVVIPVMFIISGVFQLVAMLPFNKKAKKAE